VETPWGASLAQHDRTLHPADQTKLQVNPALATRPLSNAHSLAAVIRNTAATKTGAATARKRQIAQQRGFCVLPLDV